MLFALAEAAQRGHELADVACNFIAEDFMIRRQFIAVGIVTATLGAASARRAMAGSLTILKPGSTVYDGLREFENLISMVKIGATLTQGRLFGGDFGGHSHAFSAYAQDVFAPYQHAVKKFQEWRNRFDRQALQSLGRDTIGRMAKDMGVEASVLRDLENRTADLNGNLRRLLDMYRTFESAANAARMTPRQYLAFENQRFALHKSADRSFYSNVVRTVAQVSADTVRIAQLGAMIPAESTNDGATSLRSMNEVMSAHLNLLANQNAQVISLMSENMLLGTAQRHNEASAREAQKAAARDEHEANHREARDWSRQHCLRAKVAWASKAVCF